MKTTDTSPKYTDIEKLKAWISKRYKLEVVGQGPNLNGWPSFLLSDSRVIRYEDDRWTPTRRLRKHTLFYIWSGPEELPEAQKQYYPVPIMEAK